jgi:hypothetical protein
VLRYDEADLVAYVAGNPSAVALALYDTSDEAAAAGALRRAARGIGRIPHPREPDTSLPNWCEVLHEGDVPVLHLDMKDEAHYAEQVVGIVLDELRSAGVDGLLEPRHEPPPPFDYDAGADIFGGTRPLAELDDRDLPPGFPAGFPVPGGGTLVLAESARDGTWEHAAWRRTDGPFASYPGRLRAYGCDLGAVPPAEVADFVATTCMVRYSLRRAGRDGSVSLYHEWCRTGQRPSTWFVSVVWDVGAGPPVAAADPGPAAEPAQAAEPGPPAVFVVPAGQETAGETVLAVREAALAVSGALSGPHCHHEPTLARHLHGRLAPLLDGLDTGRLVAVRHACLTMVSNWVYHGMVRMRLPLAHDDTGHLYAPDIRREVASLDPDEVVAVEALLVLRTAATVLDPLYGNLSTGALVEGADRLARTVEGLGADRLTDLRDAARHLVARGRTSG